MRTYLPQLSTRKGTKTLNFAVRKYARALRNSRNNGCQHLAMSAKQITFQAKTYAYVMEQHSHLHGIALVNSDIKGAFLRIFLSCASQSFRVCDSISKQCLRKSA